MFIGGKGIELFKYNTESLFKETMLKMNSEVK